MVKNLSASAGDVSNMGLIPGSGRSPGGGNGNPRQYSCLENPMDRGAWQATDKRVWVTKKLDTTEEISMHARSIGTNSGSSLCVGSYCKVSDLEQVVLWYFCFPWSVVKGKFSQITYKIFQCRRKRRDHVTDTNILTSQLCQVYFPVFTADGFLRCTHRRWHLKSPPAQRQLHY